MRSQFFLLCLALCPSTASAQRPVAAPVAVVQRMTQTAAWPLAPRVSAVAARPSRGRRAAIGAAVGVVVGGTVGAVRAAQRVHRSSVIDHSEDGLVYFVHVSGGAVVGLLVGTVTGLAWPD